MSVKDKELRLVSGDVCQQIREGRNLSLAEMNAVIDQLMRGLWSEDDTVQLLLALSDKGETVEELAGAAAALRQHMTPIRTRHSTLLDTCGTGGDASGTFNISTAAAIVVAAAGVPVAKHGNRSITSRSGSADVLKALGVNIEASVQTVERCLDELKIGFCFAPQLHPSMRHVAGARKKLGRPSIFNLLGPLCNPASAPYQLLGVGKPHLRRHLASTLCLLGTKRALVVSGEDGLDEVTLSGVTHVTEVYEGSLRDWDWRPEDFGLASAPIAALCIDGPLSSAAMIRDVLAGSSGPHRDIVVLNAAAALWLTGFDQSPPRCTRQATRAIESGAAAEVLQKLAEWSQSS